MSTFGQYVHLTWEGYKRFGTRQWDQTSSNFNANIFNKHRNAVLSQAKHMEIKNLKNMETTYNKMNENAYKLLKELTSSKSNIDNLKALLHVINKSWSNDQLDEIVQHLKWNDKTQRFSYTGKALMGKSGAGGDFKSIPEGSSFYAKALVNRIDRILLTLKDLYAEEVPPQKNALEALKKDIIETANIQIQKYKIKNSIENVEKMYSEEGKGTLYYIKRKPGYAIAKKFNEIIESCLSAKQVNEQIAYRLPEIIGQIATSGAISVLKNDFIKGLKQSIGASTRFTTKNQQIEIYWNLNEAVLEEAFQDDFLKKAVDQFITEDGSKVSYQLREVGEGRQQKADIEWIVNSKGKNMGISMKSTYLQVDEFTIPNISLQSSSLLLYLLGIQQNFGAMEMGNHYLNILANHEDSILDIGNYSKIRSQADAALTLAVTFSALTGGAQLRKGGQARILAISDRKKNSEYPLVRFFDMGKIIQNLNIQLGEAGDLYKEISKISLKNDYIEGTESPLKLASKRITKLIIAARAETLHAKLSKEFLLNIY